MVTNTAYMIGVGTKSGKWRFDYNYREIELNSVYDGGDSDFHDGGTGGKGHKFKAKYALKRWSFTRCDLFSN